MTIRRGGSLTDADHRLLALWAASCAEHVLQLFETALPQDLRPRQAIEHARAWVRGEVAMMQARAAGGHAMGAARELAGSPRFAAYAAGQAAVVAHVAATSSEPPPTRSRPPEPPCPKQRPDAPVGGSAVATRSAARAIRALVLDDQRLRNDLCWSVFDC